MNDKLHKITSLAIIIDSLNGGGAEKVCITLARQINEMGVKAHLFVLKRHCDYELPDDLNVHFIYDDPYIKLHKPRVQIAAARKLNAIISRMGYFDAYFSNLDECHAIVDRANLPNTYFVIHNSVENTIKRTQALGPTKYQRKLSVFERLNHKDLICVSVGVAHEIREGKLISPRSINTIYNPLDVDAIREQIHKPEPEIPNEPFIIFVGRVARQKRIDILLQAFKHVKQDVALVFLGYDSKKLSRMIENAKVDKKVYNFPFSQNPYAWIKSAKALVLSSDYEGFGMVLVEALACQTPVASTACPYGPEEILTGELANFLAPVASPIQLAEKIDLAISQPEKFQNAPILENVKARKVSQQYIELASNAKKKVTKAPINITFYLPNYDALDKLDHIDPYSAWREMPRGEGFWILQTYCFLRHFGLNVSISKDLPSEGVLVFHRRNKSHLFKQPHKKIKNLILVGCRGDLHDIHVPDFELLQNNFFADGERRFAMPHWPMPHIKPRDNSRGQHIKRIAFKGFAAQLHPDFRSDEWHSFLISHNIEWVQNDVGFTLDGKSTFDEALWADYSDIDLVIAVRPERNELHTNKPALKLYNAWLAKVPAILGKEYAYREVGVNGEDYIEVSNLEDAKKAILHLINNPGAYEKMIQHGAEKAHHYTHEAVFKAWQFFLCDTLPDRIERRKNTLRYKIERHIPLQLRYVASQMLKTLSRRRLR